MKTVTIFIGGYLPAKKYGGPVTSIANLADNLGDEIDIRIVSNNHDLDETAVLSGIHDGWNQVGNAKVTYLYDREYSKRKFVELLKECHADVVYLSSVFFYQMNVPAIRAAKSLKLPIILAPRGELCANALNLGKLKKQVYLFALKMSGLMKGLFYHVTSQEEYETTKSIFRVNNDKLFLFPNMPCKPSVNTGIEKESGKARFVFISRIQEKKNLLFAIEQIGKLDGNVVFDIYGPLEQPQYWEKCKKAIKKAKANVTISYKGALMPGTSRDIFSQYHCFVFPTLSENYGHVIAEAISSGCLLAVSKGTTPWDDIAGKGGWVCPLEDTASWQNALIRLVNMDSNEFTGQGHLLADYTEKKLATSELKRKYLDMFNT